MPSNECLVILCGIPGAGKSSLVKSLVDYINPFLDNASNVQNEFRPWNVVHPVVLCYDDIMPSNLPLENKPGVSDNAGLWKRQRQEIVVSVGQFLSLISMSRENELPKAQKPDVWSFDAKVELCSCLSPGQKRDNHEEILHVFIIDDNMFYRSMRYNYYRLARGYSTGFCQIFVNCDISTAQQRNSQRKVKVSEKSLARVAEKFEKPNAATFSWEAATFEVYSDYVITDSVLDDLCEFIVKASNNPVQPLPEEDEEAKKLARLITSNSTVHHVDQILRGHISQQLKEFQTADAESRNASIKQLAATLNKQRKQFLERLRSDEHLKRYLTIRIDEVTNTLDGTTLSDQSQGSAGLSINKSVLQEAVVGIFLETIDHQELLPS